MAPWTLNFSGCVVVQPLWRVLSRLITCGSCWRRVLLRAIGWLLFVRFSRCVVGIWVCFEEGKDVCQGDDGFVRTEPLAQGALDGLDEVHSVLLSAFTRVAARKRRRMNARKRA